MAITLQEKVKRMPNVPGVYYFLGAPKRGEGGLGKILYIGKATLLRSRVRSYFTGNMYEKRSPLIGKMMEQVKGLKFQETDSVLEALILEANLIKKFRPPYNTAAKDEKSWNFVVITEEDFPRILVIRERELKQKDKSSKPKASYGPFTNSSELKEALKIIRKIFPYRDRCAPSPSGRVGVGCFNYQIGLCPGVCTGAVSKKEYSYILKNIRMIFEGKKTALVKSLQKEMKTYAQNRDFEKANEVKRRIFALQHIQDIALLKNSKFEIRNSKFRIEAYDVAHISGTNVVGVMTVVENGEVKKSDYRKFKIKIQKNDDIAALREIISRRLKHSEWPYPDLIVLDGGEAQMNAAREALESKGLNIPAVAVVKDQRHKPKEIRGVQFIDKKREIFLANSEAHRFAIKYHRDLRSRLS